MARSVVLNHGPRCARCQQPPRWCVCAGLAPVVCPLKVDVLLHHEEACRPSSTGLLLGRVVADCRVHLYRREQPPSRATIAAPGREIWVLHPQGEPPPRVADPAAVQVLLLDGNWRQAGELSRVVESWGRRVSLPAGSVSRYWLRAQAGEGKYSTAEALLLLLTTLGLREAEAALRLQFELHVYASLRARGQKERAEAYLAMSPLGAGMADFLEKMHRPRACVSAPPGREGTRG